MPLFCRHNRLTANCPICSREMEAELRSKLPPRTRRPSAPRRPAAERSRPRTGPGRSGGVVTRRLARAADDGYRNPLVPGLRATADAERLAAALAAAAERLRPPGPYPELASATDVEDATWLAFLLALAGRDSPALQEAVLAARPAWATAAEPVDLPPERAQTATAYRAWVERAGSQAAAFTGEAAWTPQRRFARLFERLALPGFVRAARFEMLTALGAAGVHPVEADSLFLAAGEDSTTEAAKRLLVSGDKLLLERRARELAEACSVPIAALDRALAVWGTPGESDEPGAEPPAAVRAALGLR